MRDIGTFAQFLALVITIVLTTRNVAVLLLSNAESDLQMAKTTLGMGMSRMSTALRSATLCDIECVLKHVAVLDNIDVLGSALIIRKARRIKRESVRLLKVSSGPGVSAPKRPSYVAAMRARLWRR